MRKSTVKDRKWRKSVIGRDKVCVICGSDEDLEAHHICDYSTHPKKRYSVHNGKTMCRRCHSMYHCSYNYSYRIKTNKKNWDNFIEFLQKVKKIEIQV